MQKSFNIVSGHAVISWSKKKNGKEFPKKFEAISLKKLIVEGTVEPSTVIRMQYRNELWEGEVISIHSKTSVIFYIINRRVEPKKNIHFLLLVPYMQC